MGRIKTVLVKRTTTRLVKASPEKFGKDFNKNKEAVSELAVCRSKKLRNIIAGYTVRLTRKAEEGPRRKKKPAFKPRGGGFRRPRSY